MLAINARTGKIAPIVRVFKLGQEPKDVHCWRSRPAKERLAMIEHLRREYYGQKYDSEPDPSKLFTVFEHKLTLTRA